MTRLATTLALAALALVPTSGGAAEGDSATLKLTDGSVRVMEPGGEWRALDDPVEVPKGTLVDTTDGRVNITTTGPDGEPQSAWFWEGKFVITRTTGITELRMRGGNFRVCSASGAKAAQRRRKVRRLFGEGKGRFRTRGRFSSATVRGTEWWIEDDCSGTSTIVRKGVVDVRDLVKRRTIRLRSGQRYRAASR